MPRRSIQLVMAWPKPIEKTSTCTPHQAGGEVVAELVHEHQDAEHDRERDPTAEDVGNDVEHVDGSFGSLQVTERNSGGAGGGEARGGAAGSLVQGDHLVQRVGGRRP